MVLDEVTKWRSVCVFIAIRTFSYLLSLSSPHLLLPSLFFLISIRLCARASPSVTGTAVVCLRSLGSSRLQGFGIYPEPDPGCQTPGFSHFIFMPSVDIFYIRMVCKSENKMQDKKRQHNLEGKWTIKKIFGIEQNNAE